MGWDGDDDSQSHHCPGVCRRALCAPSYATFVCESEARLRGIAVFAEVVLIDRGCTRMYLGAVGTPALAPPVPGEAIAWVLFLACAV